MRTRDADPPTLPYGVKDDEERRDSPPDTLVTPPQGLLARGSLSPEPVLSGAIVTEDPTRAAGTYAFGDVIGRGGMGEVVLAHDRRIGRDVAIKRLRTASPSQDEVSRFLREARIQARLDHPAIVPVYELGKDEVGRPFFTMKRVAGATLVDVLRARTATRQRLLRAFADVCRAVDFAHARGVVHRDLKPANIVLGEYGEVYVLDWGVARVLPNFREIDTLEPEPSIHDTLGTPGYMAPEQLASPEVEGTADVYALGAILFELLTGEPLHPRASALESTRSRETRTSPAMRHPEANVEPELDALCIVMLSRDPRRRGTARWCAEQIEDFLDGDRDVARRRALAGELLERARAAQANDRRADAMRTASRALALDPESEPAAELVTTLMLEPPRVAPTELREALHRADAADISRHARAAIPGYVLIAGFLPLVIACGVRDWLVVLATVASALAMAVAAYRLVVRPHRSLGWMIVYGIGNAAVMVLLSRLAGPFTFVPALVSFITASVITYPVFLERAWLLLGIMLAGFVAPFGLELAGVLESTWELRDSGIYVRGNAMDLTGPLPMLTVVAASVATVVMAGIQSAVLGRANRAAQHRLVAQAWHLQQLLPRTRAT